MINVIINEQEGVIKVKGHAQYDDNGHDLVCAGVSALTWALIMTLENRDMLDHAEEESGDMAIYYESTDKSAEIVDFYMNGINMLTFRYPENVSVQGRNDNL